MTDTPRLAGEDDLVAVAAERETLEGEFESACAASRQVAARFTLDRAVLHDQLGQVSLRWIYVHIIREHARHIGHADILREQTDGATGD